MKSSRRKRITALGDACRLESLETRELLSVTLGSAIANETVGSGQTFSVNLGSHFNDPVVGSNTAVLLQTSLSTPNSGGIPLVLTSAATPKTVANFVSYINSGAYNNTIFHRSATGFVIQGGGYTPSGTHITQQSAVQGENSSSTLHNVAGTISMALSTGPNSGTSEYFINLGDNSSLLDGTSDGGPFTPFGSVVYNGLNVVNAIAALPIVDASPINSAWNTLPVISTSAGTKNSSNQYTAEPASNLVTITPKIEPGGLTYIVTSSNTSIVTASVDPTTGQLTMVSPGASGSSNITVQAFDMGGNSATTTFSVVAGTASPITATAVTNIAATVGTPLSGTTVATFTDTTTGTTPSSYSATISWGDGTTSTGTIVAGSTSGTFSVNGTHTYTTANTFATTVAITPTGGTAVETGGSVTASTSTSTVTVSGTSSIAATTGTALPSSTTVATFTDSASGTTASSYSAVISWGDGQTSVGTVTAGASGFNVTGSHTYSTAGTFNTTTTITTTSTGATTAGTGSVVVTASSSTITATGVTNIAANPAVALSGVTVATFTDSKSGTTASGYTATINWGDGSTSAGTIVAGTSAGTFKVTGSHTYSAVQTYTTTVTITPTSGTATSTTGSVVVTAVPTTITVTGTSTLTGSIGTAIPTGTVASFTDTKSGTSASNYTATIAWGDGNTSAGTIVAGSTAGTFNVTGSHTYSSSGAFNTTVTVTPNTGTGASGTGTINIAAAVIAVSGVTNISAVAGTPLSNTTIAVFTNSAAGTTASAYTAVISWGDGSTSAGTVAAGTSNFVVSGTHTYAAAGSYTTTTTVSPTSGASATGTGSVVATGSTITPKGVTGIAAQTNTVLNGVGVATFTDSNSSNTTSSYATVINWGDGSTSAGTVVAGNNSGFVVDGSHTYTTAGTYTTTTTITPTTGSAAIATGTVIVTVSSTNGVITETPTSTIGATINTALNNITTATFVDTSNSANIGAYTATINWGDGSTSAGTIATNGAANTFKVTGTHTYTKSGTFTAATIITPTAGNQVSGSSVVNVTAAGSSSITASASTGLSATRGIQFTSMVAKFTDTLSTTTASSYSAVINWGDGTTSAGTISADANVSGQYDVSGTHTYTTADGYDTVITITPSSGTAATAMGTIFAYRPVSTVRLTGLTIKATRGAMSNLIVSNFTDTNTANTYSILIDWGDGSQSTGTTTRGAHGVYHVSATHTYASAGTYVTTTTVTQANSSVATVTGSVVVRRPAISNTATLTAVSGVKMIRGTAATPVVATFVDSILTTSASNYSVLIDWGDGSQSNGVVVRNGAAGHFNVLGTHTYGSAGSYVTTVTLTPPNEASVSATGGTVVRRPA